MFHIGVKPYVCSQCPKTFVLSNDLKRHIRIHSGEKPFSCTQCSRSFAQSGDLRKHERIHSGEKPFSCSQCSKSFAQSDDLRTHLRVHTGEKRYSCSQCSESFAQSVSLQRYLQVHGDEKPLNDPIVQGDLQGEAAWRNTNFLTVGNYFKVICLVNCFVEKNVIIHTCGRLCQVYLWCAKLFPRSVTCGKIQLC